MMKNLSILGLIMLLAVSASAEGYLIPTCNSILENDLVNLIRVNDLMGDGTPHILVGTSINGALYNYRFKGAECTTDWTAMKSGGWVYDTSGDVKSFVVTSLLADGNKQIVINSVKSSKPGASPVTQYLRAVSKNGIDFWGFKDECGFSLSVDAADLDGSGKPNVVFGTMTKSVCALKDSRDGLLGKDTVLWRYSSAAYPVYFVKTVDIDGDGGIETVALDKDYLVADVFALDKSGALRWTAKIDGGVHKPALASNIIDVADIDGDGKAETVVGTYKKGVLVFDSGGSQKWVYDPMNVVTSILVDDINGDGRREVIIGSAPKVIALDSAGTPMWTWTMPVKNGTVNSMSAYDINGDGKKEIAIGTTKYIYVLGADGTLKGSWKYTTEIKGGTIALTERNADASAIFMGDLDGSGEPGIVASWNWEQDTVRGNQYSTSIRFYKINKNYVPTQEDTATAGTDTTGGDIATDNVNTDNLDQPLTGDTSEGTADTGSDTSGTDTGAETSDTAAGTDGKKAGACSCLPMLPAVLALGMAVLLKVPMAARRD